MDHPVWEVYNLLRTVRLNELYYASKLRALKRRHFGLEVATAAAAPAAAAIAGLLGRSDAKWLPDSAQAAIAPYMGWVLVAWIGLTLLASVLALVRPISRLSESIATVGGCHVEYRSIRTTLAELRSEIQHQRTYDAELKSWFRHARRQVTIACEHEPMDTTDTKLAKRLQEQVNHELPMDGFYEPPEERSNDAARTAQPTAAGTAAPSAAEAGAPARAAQRAPGQEGREPANRTARAVADAEPRA